MMNIQEVDEQELCRLITLKQVVGKYTLWENPLYTTLATLAFMRIVAQVGPWKNVYREYESLSSRKGCRFTIKLFIIICV